MSAIREKDNRTIVAARIVRTGAVIVLALAAQAAVAQTHPDMSGVYSQRGGPGNPTAANYELTPDGQKAFDRNKAAIAAGNQEIDTALKCLPTGFPRMLFGPLPFYFLQTPKAVGVVAETDPLPRLIYIDSPHRADYWPTYMGDSVAHWEGDVLVVDTVNLIATTFADIRGLPHSDKLHIVEHIQLIDGGKTMQDQLLIDDPKIFTKAWTQTYLYDRRDDLKPVENVCENTRDKP